MKPKRPSLWAMFVQFTNTHHTASVIILCALIIGGVGIICGAFLLQKAPMVLEQSAPARAKQEIPPEKFYSPLSGIEVPDAASKTKQVTALMIENSPDSRPQSGVKGAGVVFEAIAEGGITRLLCLYQHERPGLLGPVRSLRPYYVDWVAPFDASVGHVGGSKNALDEIRNGQYKDIDQFFNGSSYWRATDRYAPHNVYTNFDRLDALNQAKGFKASTFQGFVHKDEHPGRTPTATSIKIDVSYGAFNVAYDYDAASNSYLRTLGGTPHVDRESGRVAPKTVIAMKVPMHRAFEDGYREQMQTIGHGEAFIFQDGQVTTGIWRKPARKEQIQFYDKTGHPIALNRGQTWITVTEKTVRWQ